MSFRKQVNTAAEARELLKILPFSSNPCDYDWVVGELLRAVITHYDQDYPPKDFHTESTAWDKLIEDLQAGKHALGRTLSPEESAEYTRQLQMKSIAVEKDVF